MTTQVLRLDRRVSALIFVAVFLLAMTWAFVTSHVWEDYYITYRSSKNLATGHGLVFNHGEKLHTFTSPLGVLLPAAAIRLTGSDSDGAALWLFRAWSGLAFAGTVVLLYAVARRFRYGMWATSALVAWVALDAKSIDFTTNGMETGFLLLFLSYSLWAMFASPGRRWLHLGFAWGGLMWTRPDSFLYIGLLAVGVILFNDRARSGLSRLEWVKLFLQAGLVCTVIYLPWFIWSWSYYGSAIPHTIVAKSNVSPTGRTAFGALKLFLGFPRSVWQGGTSLESTFLPSYFQIGGWPAGVVTAARALALTLAFQWILPWWKMEVRVASFTFAGIHVYLSYFPFFPFPWYLPATTLLAATTIAGMLAQVRARPPLARTHFRWLGGAVAALVLAGLCGESWLTLQMMRQMKVEQEWSSNAVRKKTGLWLKEHAKPTDTVFMEPLGHIGYFSGLKTYDFPGLSSTETPKAIHAVGTNWGRLIEYLSPDWLVLREHEINQMRGTIPRVLEETYRYVTEFNTLAEVERQSVYGLGYIKHDARWIIFQRQKPGRYLVDVTNPATLASYPLPVEEFENRGGMYKLHAAGLMSFKVPAEARRLHLAYGLPQRTYTGTPVTDGAGFVVLFFDGRSSRPLLSRYLNPAAEAADRGAQTLEVDLPAALGPREIILISDPGVSDIMDWCCWSIPQFSN